MHQRPDQMEDSRWEGQNFSEVVAPQEEEEEDISSIYYIRYNCMFRHLTMAIFRLYMK